MRLDKDPRHPELIVKSVTTAKPFSPLMTILLGITLMMLSFPQLAMASPEKKLGGKIIVSEKRFPSRFDSDKEMIKHMKKVNTHELFATGEKDWEFEYMTFLKKPVGTLQASITFYDVTVKGTEQLVDTFTFYPENAKHNILAGHQRLSKERFAPDRKYLMVFSRGYGQKALAKTIIVLRRK